MRCKFSHWPKAFLIVTIQSTVLRQKKVACPKDNDQEQAFSRMCQYFEMNDDEQLTITELASKMKEFLKCTGSLPYGNQYLKFKLLEKYGDSLYIAEGEGLHAIVTFREETSRILCDYFNTPNKDDDDAHKRAIIEAAAKFIKHDIKCITTSKNEYPNVSELNLVLAREFIPPSLRFMLENILPGKETN